MARSLQDADLVRVYAISPKFENAVTLRGNVAIPGRYPWHQGMRVRDVIPTRETLITRDYWLQQNLAATNKDIGGLPEVNWDYALITRMGPDDLSNHLLPFNLGKAIEDAASSDNLELQPGDIITISSQADVRAPERQRPIVVYLEGEVRTPGVYRVEPGESLRDLVARVGGFTPQAYLFGSEFTRESTRLEQQARLEEMAQQIQRDAQRNATLLAAKAGDNTGLAAKLQLQQSMVNTMKPLKATGRMVLNLRPSASTVDALPKLVLEDGDHFYVPSRSSSLSVFGEVVTPSTFVFEPRKRIRDYLRDAGGMTRLADGSRTYVLRANGSTVSVRSSADLWNGRTDDLKLMPGDAIVVSQRLPQIGIMSGVRDWAQLLSQFGLTAAAINVLR